MDNYIGENCPQCKMKIKKDEEVKVCPYCGIPHHASCWEENNGCAVFGCAGHYSESQGSDPAEVCDKCGNPLRDGQAFCSACGTLKISRQVKCGKCGAMLNNQTFCSVCGQKAGVLIDPVVSSAITQFNQNIKSDKPKKSNVWSVLAIVFGLIGLIPVFNFIFLPLSIVFAIIGLCVSKKTKKTTAIAGAFVSLLSLVVSICFILVMFVMDQNVSIFLNSTFNEMYSDIEGKYWCEIAPDGSWMEIDTNPHDIDDFHVSEALSKIESINLDLGFSSAVYKEMLGTKALDGRQTESNDKYTVTWTYHPDTGMEVLYKINE